MPTTHQGLIPTPGEPFQSSFTITKTYFTSPTSRLPVITISNYAKSSYQALRQPDSRPHSRPNIHNSLCQTPHVSLPMPSQRSHNRPATRYHRPTHQAHSQSLIHTIEKENQELTDDPGLMADVECATTQRSRFHKSPSSSAKPIRALPSGETTENGNRRRLVVSQKRLCRKRQPLLNAPMSPTGLWRPLPPADPPYAQTSNHIQPPPADYPEPPASCDSSKFARLQSVVVEQRLAIPQNDQSRSFSGSDVSSPWHATPSLPNSNSRAYLHTKRTFERMLDNSSLRSSPSHEIMTPIPRTGGTMKKLRRKTAPRRKSPSLTESTDTSKEFSFDCGHRHADAPMDDPTHSSAGFPLVPPNIESRRIVLSHPIKEAQVSDSKYQDRFPLDEDEEDKKSVVRLPTGHSESVHSVSFGDNDPEFVKLSIPAPEQAINTQVSVLMSRLDSIFSDITQYRQLLKCEGEAAQTVLDSFQALLDMPQVNTSTQRGQLVVATQRLSERSGIYPKCYKLDNVQRQSGYRVKTGGSADIYKGTINGQVVCLKVIRMFQNTDIHRLLKVFSKEAILWGQLKHRHVLPMYGLYQFQNETCFVAPWMEAGDVNDYLKNNPSAPRRRLAMDAAQGLLYLHENEIIHGDLKGANILVNAAGVACLADFGLSTISDPLILSWMSQPSAASSGGTVRWQAPELFDVESDSMVRNGMASDIYALICVCYEIFTGLVPFWQYSLDAVVILQIITRQQPSRPLESSLSWTEWGLTESIWSLMERGWSFDPKERPSVQDVIDELSLNLDQDTRPSDGNLLSPSLFRQGLGRVGDVASVVATLNQVLDDALIA